MSRQWHMKISAIAAVLMICLGAQCGAFGAQPAGSAVAVSAETSAPTTIRVAALDNPPYVSDGPKGLQGLSISTFKILAAKNNWKVNFILERTQDEMVNAIITHHADIGIGGITPTPELSLIVDFSDANQIVPLALLVKKEGYWAHIAHMFKSTLGVFVSGPMVALYAVGIIVVLVAGYFIRIIERRRAAEMFPDEFRENAWWAAQTMIAHNCGSKLPFSERGRYIAIMLMLGGTIFTAEVTALLTTSLAASIAATAPMTGIGHVGHRRIATVDESYAQDWLQQNLFDIRSYKTVQNCVEAVEKGQVSGAVFDEVALRRVLIQGHFTDLAIVGDIFGSHPHAFMVAKRSPYLDPLNQSLGAFLASNQWSILTAQWGVSQGE